MMREKVGFRAVGALTALLLILAATPGTTSPATVQAEEIDDPMTLLRLGIALIKNNQAAEAVSYLRRSIDYLPENGESHMWLGFAYFLSQDFDLAEESYYRALHHNPELTEVRNYLGMLRWQQGDLGQAIDEFELALKDPAYPLKSKATVLINLGNVQRDRGDLEEALERIRQALDLVEAKSDPGYALANLSLGQTLIELGRQAEAIPALERVLEVEPGNAEAYLQLGFAHRDSGQKDDACTALRQVLVLAPGTPQSERATAAREQLSC